jgi:hypothetical protein
VIDVHATRERIRKEQSIYFTFFFFDLTVG